MKSSHAQMKSVGSAPPMLQVTLMGADGWYSPVLISEDLRSSNRPRMERLDMGSSSVKSDSGVGNSRPAMMILSGPHLPLPRTSPPHGLHQLLELRRVDVNRLPVAPLDDRQAHLDVPDERLAHPAAHGNRDLTVVSHDRGDVLGAWHGGNSISPRAKVEHPLGPLLPSFAAGQSRQTCLAPGRPVSRDPDVGAGLKPAPTEIWRVDATRAAIRPQSETMRGSGSASARPCGHRAVRAGSRPRMPTGTSLE